MRIQRPRREKGMVLPTLIMLTLVLLILAGALLSSGTSSLRVATFDQQSDQATYASEAGLVRAVEAYAKAGTLASGYSDDVGSSGSRFEVSVFENPGAGEKQIAGGPLIPGKTLYLMSEGISENGTRRRTGALFRMGLEAFQVGALADTMVANNTVFDAYDSEREASGYNGASFDPSAVETDAAILASNTSTGTTFDFDNVEVKGAMYVGPGGDKEAQIAKKGATNITRAEALKEAIDVAEIEVPGGEIDDDDAPQIPTLQTFEFKGADANGVWSFSDGLGLDFQIGDSTDNQFSHVKGSNGQTVIHGTESVGGMMVEFCQVKQANGHTVNFHPDGSYFYSLNSVAYSGFSTDLASKVFGGAVGGGGGGSASVNNPSLLAPDRYESVTIDKGFTASLASEGTYVIKDLVIRDLGKLKLPTNGKGVNIYVTGNLTVEGENALLNETRKAPKLKVFYTGTDPVNLSGGSSAFFTLIAPKANLSLKGVSGIKTQFFGALVGKKVDVEHASFHYDIATAGIGTGTAGSGLSLISRFRL